jgi:hypothetical protein
MNAELATGTVSKDLLDKFAAGSLSMPQVKCHTEHYFGPNIYIREIVIPAGHVIVGKSHKVDHLCSMIEGKMIVVNADGVRKELTAPAVFVAGKGRKMAYIVETVRFQNIFSTPETDIEKLEAMFVEEVDYIQESDTPSMIREN